MRFYRKPTLFFLNVFLFLIKTNAQQSVLLNQSSYNLFVLNPAAIGLSTVILTNCHYKKNWMGLTDSPELLQLTVDGALQKNKYGLGLNLINEKAGIFSKTYLSGAFRYKIKLNNQHNLLFGLSAGFQRQLSDFSKIKADAPAEFAQWPQQQAVLIPDAAFGLIYIYKKIIIGVSANQLLQKNYTYREPVYNKEFQYKTISHFVFSLQNTFVLKPETWFYTPQLTVRTPQGLPVQLDVINTIGYRDKLFVGVGYRYFYALYANLGYCITERLRVIYSYEYSQGIQSYTKGGHELGVRFGISNKTNKQKTPEHHLNIGVVDEVFEKLDKQTQQIGVLTEKIDSLDKNLSQLKIEIEILMSKQISSEDLQSLFNDSLKKYKTQNYSYESPKNDDAESEKNETNKGDKNTRYSVISPKNGDDESTLEIEVSANYKIVMGVYQVDKYARDYQRFLKRELNWDSKLIQLNDHPKKFIYVCVTKEYVSFKEALIELQAIRRSVKSRSIEVTKGEAWILQTISD